MVLKVVKIIGRILKIIFVFPFAFTFAVLSVNSIFIILPVLSAVFLVYKCVIVLLAKCIIPDSRMLTIQDQMMARDDFHSDTDLYLHCQWVFEGKIKIDDFTELFEERVIKKLLPNGNLKFPELQCYIDPFLGYFFYKREKKFNLKSHIQLYNNDPPGVVDRKKLDKIVKKFTFTLYPLKRSPWEILIVNNCRLDDEDGKEYSVVIYKCHHCLGDAYSIGITLFLESLYLQEMKPFGKQSGVKPNKSKIVSSVLAAACGFYSIIFRLAFDYIYDPRRLYDQNKWHSPKKSSQFVHCTLPPVQTSLVKEICSKSNVSSTTTVLMAIICGGFRRMMESKGLKSPKYIRGCLPLPLPNHPDRLTTYATMTVFNHNFNCPDEIKRLQINDRNINFAARAVIIFGTPFLTFFLNPFPIAWQRYNPVRTSKAAPLSATTFLTNGPLPSSGEIELLGCRLARVYMFCEISPTVSNPATVIAITKYMQDFFITYAIQEHLLSSEDQIYEIEKYVLEELTHLRKIVLEIKGELPKENNAANDAYDNKAYV